MTKKELFEINIVEDDSIKYSYITKLLLNHLYNKHYKDIFIIYKKDILIEFINCLIIMNNYIFRNIACTNEFIIIRIENIITQNIDLFKKFLNFYSKCNNKFLLNLVNFDHIMVNIAEYGLNNPFKKWLNNENLTFDDFINDLIILNDIYENYFLISNACGENKCDVGELANYHRNNLK